VAIVANIKIVENIKIIEVLNTYYLIFLVLHKEHPV
jgi:hypothetical protein